MEGEEFPELPACLKISQELRDVLWAERPPQPYTPVQEGARTKEITDPGTLALMEELKHAKDTKRETSLAKSAGRKSDRENAKSGKRWDATRARWID